MHEKLPPGITLIQADDFQTWLMDIQVIDSNPLYQGETYRLKFSFTPQYPIEVDTPPHTIFHHPSSFFHSRLSYFSPQANYREPS
jgi:ubiquitin-conjugating enzyme E2 W